MKREPTVLPVPIMVGSIGVRVAILPDGTIEQIPQPKAEVIPIGGLASLPPEERRMEIHRRTLEHLTAEQIGLLWRAGQAARQKRQPTPAEAAAVKVFLKAVEQQCQSAGVPLKDFFFKEDTSK